VTVTTTSHTYELDTAQVCSGACPTQCSRREAKCCTIGCATPLHTLCVSSMLQRCMGTPCNCISVTLNAIDPAFVQSSCDSTILGDRTARCRSGFLPGCLLFATAAPMDCTHTSISHLQICISSFRLSPLSDIGYYPWGSAPAYLHLQLSCAGGHVFFQKQKRATRCSGVSWNKTNTSSICASCICLLCVLFVAARGLLVVMYN
jgi:hypothetical protein